jgi:hypothetical protein
MKTLGTVIGTGPGCVSRILAARERGGGEGPSPRITSTPVVQIKEGETEMAEK